MEQPTAGNDKDKIPASSGTELGWFIRSSNNMIYFIMVYIKKILSHLLLIVS